MASLFNSNVFRVILFLGGTYFIYNNACIGLYTHGWHRETPPAHPHGDVPPGDLLADKSTTEIGVPTPMEFGYVKCCHGNVLTNSLQQAAYHISWLDLVCERNTYFGTNIRI